MWRLIPLLLLAACSAGPPVASAGQHAGLCRLELAADLPATTDGNRLQVIARVNGVETAFVVDTGSERTLLTTSTVTTLHLPRSQRTGTLLTGLGGVVRNADTAASLELGRLRIQGTLAVADLPSTGGVLGADVLSRFDLELDVPNSRVRLWQAENCGALDLPWTGPRAMIPVTVTQGARLRLPLQIDGQPVVSLLDSGAAGSLMQRATAHRLGVSDDDLGAAPHFEARGVGGAPVTVQLHRFGTLAIGGDTLVGPRIGVADFELPSSAEMLLGVDYLRIRRVWVSYRLGQLFIQAWRSRV